MTAELLAAADEEAALDMLHDLAGALTYQVTWQRSCPGAKNLL